jgi:hypothetical protein
MHRLKIFYSRLVPSYYFKSDSICFTQVYPSTGAYLVTPIYLSAFIIVQNPLYLKVPLKTLVASFSPYTYL